jgi:ABC-type multidrug transport system ATPase subunit
VLQAIQLTKCYGSLRALSELDFTIAPGEIVALLGANGAGKTTTLKLLVGVTAPTWGRAEVCGRPAGDARIRGRIGYSPESPRFHEFLSVEDTLAYYAELSRIPKRDRHPEIARVVSLTGLDAVRGRRAGQLSKGEAQRLSVAQALLGDPPILVLDEPSSGLDPLGRVGMRRLLADCRDRRKTILLSSHILSDVELLCDRALILRRGMLVWSGTLRDRSGEVPLEQRFLELHSEEDVHAADHARDRS